MEPRNPLETSFRDVQWLQHIPLTRETALDYFRLSGFYDTNNNIQEQARMQNVEASQIHEGIEYVLVEPHLTEQDGIFLIRKHYRTGQRSIVPLTFYYIIEGEIFQAPDLFSLINSRLSSCLQSIEKAFSKAREFAHFDVHSGYTWKFPTTVSDEAVVDSSTKAALAAASSELVNAHVKERIDKILNDLEQKSLPAVSNVANTAAKSNTGTPNTSTHPSPAANQVGAKRGADPAVENNQAKRVKI